MTAHAWLPLAIALPGALAPVWLHNWSSPRKAAATGLARALIPLSLAMFDQTTRKHRR